MYCVLQERSMVLPRGNASGPGTWEAPHQKGAVLIWIPVRFSRLLPSLPAGCLPLLPSPLCRILHPYSSEFICSSSSHLQRLNGYFWISVWNLRDRERERENWIGPICGHGPACSNQPLPLKSHAVQIGLPGLLSKEHSGLWELGRHCRRGPTLCFRKRRTWLGDWWLVSRGVGVAGDIGEEKPVESLP